MMLLEMIKHDTRNEQEEFMALLTLGFKGCGPSEWSLESGHQSLASSCRIEGAAIL